MAGMDPQFRINSQDQPDQRMPKRWWLWVFQFFKILGKNNDNNVDMDFYFFYFVSGCVYMGLSWIIHDYPDLMGLHGILQILKGPSLSRLFSGATACWITGSPQKLDH